MPTGKRILIFDEDHQVDCDAGEALRLRGYQVTFHAQLFKAVAALKKIKSSTNYALALINAKAPDMAGIDLARMLRQRAIAARIVFLADSATDESEIRRHPDFTEHAILCKPLDLSLILQLLAD